MKRLSVIILALLALVMPAQAQSTWATPQTATGGPTVMGGVGLCLNGSGLAVPCGASTPAYVYPGTGATWNIGTGGLGTASTPLSVSPLNYGVGTASFNSPAPVTVATTATLLVAARTGAVGTGRAAVTITCAAAVAIAPTSGVTFAGNAQIPAGAGLTLNTTSAVYGIASGSSTTCDVWETF